MGSASLFRASALDITKEVLNKARSELRRELVTEAGRTFQPPSKRGAPSVQLDTRVNGFMRHAVATRHPTVTYWSEEERRAYSPEPRDVFAWSDPFDGTTQAFTTLGPYSIVLFFDAFSGTRERFTHLAGAIASSSGEVVSWQHFQGGGEVWIDWPGSLVWPGTEITADAVPKGELPASRDDRFGVRIGIEDGDIPMKRGTTSRWAALASSGERRMLLAQNFELDDHLWVTTIGGNPCIAPLLVGDLSAVIEVKRIDLHDAAYLLPLVLAGGVVQDLSGAQLDVWELFGEPNVEQRLIGPFVAATGRDIADEVLARCRLDLSEQT